MEEEKEREMREKEEVRVKRKTLKAVLEQCQRALESLNLDDDDNFDDDGNDDDDGCKEGGEERESTGSSSSSCPDPQAEILCSLIKSRVEGPEFLEKIGNAQMAEEGNSWDMVNDSDIWEGGKEDADREDYVVVRQEDIVDGIACFMAAYLLSLKQTKDLTPNQLQEALSKTFAVKTKKGKLRKAFDGSKVIYNVASWSATAIGLYVSGAFVSHLQALSPLPGSVTPPTSSSATLPLPSPPLASMSSPPKVDDVMVYMRNVGGGHEMRMVMRFDDNDYDLW